MAWINITTDDGELLERIDLDDYDLSKPLARSSLVDQIEQAAARGSS